LDPKHDSQEFVLQEKFLRSNAILCLKQPPAAACFDVMEGVACGALHYLKKVGLGVPRHNVPERSLRAFLREAVHGH
jgi:hypothetical protein